MVGTKHFNLAVVGTKKELPLRAGELSMMAFHLRDTLDFPSTCVIGMKDRMCSRSSVVLKTFCAGLKVLLVDLEDMMGCGRRCVVVSVWSM